jgi:hypothetical protein
MWKRYLLPSEKKREKPDEKEAAARQAGFNKKYI